VEQLLMRKFIMLKMFLSAVCTGFLILAALSKLASTTANFNEARKKKTSGSRGIPATVLGAALLGAGMALSGACPGTVWVQMGSGVIPGSAVVLAGALVGSVVWTFTKKPIEGTSFFTWGQLKPNQLNLDVWLGWPFWAVSLGFAAMIGAAVFTLEYLMPYTQELGFLIDAYPSTNYFMDVAWPPYVSGFLVGLLQLPALTLLTTTIGSSTGFTVFTSLILYPLKEKNDFIRSRVTDRMNFFQPLYLLAAVLGGTAAAISSMSLHINMGLSPALSFFGGFFILFGSQLGGGCTSGHGISGFQTLAVPSIVGTAAMFGGGIAMAYILYFAGAYGDTLNNWPMTF